MKIVLTCILLTVSLFISAQTHYPIPDITWSPELQGAAEKGDVEAMRNLGICIIEELGITADENTAFPWFEKAAKKGDPESMTYVGDFYYGEFGDLFDEDVKTAFKWYKKAADMGHPFGIYRLAECYELGDGIPEDENKYLQLLHQAADMGCPDACYQLACKYKEGKTISKDMDKYNHYFTLAADGGILNALTTMGKAYYSGKGVGIDYDRAFRYFCNAIKYIEEHDSGYGWLGEGMRMLSACYRFGRGCKPDEALADKCLEIASHIESLKANEIKDALKTINFNNVIPTNR